ncbi:MAG: phasin family protein [Pseudomonadota bacterium]
MSTFDQPGFEIPENVRDMAEQNLKQARSAYGQFMDMARQAQDMAAKSQGQMMQSALDVQAKALQFAERNIEENFNFAADLARARDLQQYAEIQARHAKRQMQAFSDQAGELNKMMTDAASKAAKT